MASKGAEITVIGRKGYTKKDEPYEYRGVKIVPIASPHTAGLEAFVHTFRSILKVRKLHPDIVHLHAIGPAFVAPIFRMLGIKSNKAKEFQKAQITVKAIFIDLWE